MTQATSAVRAREAAWRAARNILAVRLDHLGEVLMSTPALQALKLGSPDTRVTLLASRSGAALARHVPAIDEVISYDAPWMKGRAHGDLSDRRLIATLRRGHFDAAVIFTSSQQSALPAALLCRLAGIPLRLAHCREHPHDLLTDWVADTDLSPESARHEVQRQLDLVRAIGFHAPDERLVFRYAAADVLSMRRKFQAAGGDPTRPFIVVHPGAASVRWPAARFGLAAEAICQDSGCQAVFTGGHDERALVQEARDSMQEPSVSLAGQLTLGELAALIAGAEVAVCNNSGPAHMAAALDTPVVVLYAQSHAHHAPWRARAHVLSHDLPCEQCTLGTCTDHLDASPMQVLPDEVAEAALDLLEPPPAVWRAPQHPVHVVTMAG